MNNIYLAAIAIGVIALPLYAYFIAKYVGYGYHQGRAAFHRDRFQQLQGATLNADHETEA